MIAIIGKTDTTALAACDATAALPGAAARQIASRSGACPQIRAGPRQGFSYHKTEHSIAGSNERKRSSHDGVPTSTIAWE
jgi:hypothetical protein